MRATMTLCISKPKTPPALIAFLLQKKQWETVKIDWTSTEPNQIAVTVPLKKVKPAF